MLFQAAVLLCALVLAAGYSCPNRLYRGQHLNVSQFLCSRNQNYRLLFNNTGQVQVNEPFPRETSFKPPPQTLFSTNTTSPSPAHVTFTDAGDFVAVGMDGTVYWQANVTGADFLEVQDTGIAVLFSKNASTVRVLWKSLSMYSLRLVGGTNQTGRLEFYFNSTWGSVGNNSFSTMAANTACRTLGFDTGVVITNTFGPSPGPIWMDIMKCSGRESAFQECPFGLIQNHPPNNWWGLVSASHNTDVAISCQGTSLLGVLSPTAHVCSDRLYVGQTLALGDCLCAGPNGEYTLRFSNKRKDTVIELWYKLKRKWTIGMTNTMPAGVAARLDSDGVMRIVGTGTGLPYSLFSNTTANASFVELQDNGVVRIVSVNGSTGWRKAPDDSCYTERGHTRSQDGTAVASETSSPLHCLAFCGSHSTCNTATFAENDATCQLWTGYPWDTSTTNSTYFEKIPGCSSGSACYQNYSYDLWDLEPYINFANNKANASICTGWCDTTAGCLSAYFTPPSACYLGCKRLNETTDAAHVTSYYRKVPCNPVASSQVALLPVKDCPVKLLAGSFLLSQQYICSPNGQHVLTVEKDGRLLIDGGQWASNSAANSSGYLQYTTTNQLFLLLDDKSIAWKADSVSSPAGYLALSDAGRLQMFDSFGSVTWDHQSGFRTYLMPLDDDSRPLAMNLFDSNLNTCVSGRSSAMLSYQLGQMVLNQTFTLTLVGQNLRCGSVSSVGNYLFSMYHLATSSNGTPQSGEQHDCRLISDASQSCRFECVCQSVSCEILTLRYVGCGIPDGSVCEVIMQ